VAKARRAGLTLAAGAVTLPTVSPIVFDIGRLVVGAVLLYLGAESLVRGASGLALALRVPPLIVGLTVVAYGTSAPELVVGMAAAADGRGAVALGNVVGSNIANLGLILGVTALVKPPRVDGGLVWREIPLLALTSVLPMALLATGRIGRIPGGLLVAASFAYTGWLVRASLRAHRGRAPEVSTTRAAVAESRSAAGATPTHVRLLLLALLGLGVLVAAGKVFVDGAVGVATAAGMSERVVGLTIVAVGTSLPELAASLVAAVRGHSALAVGNVVGSNIFNILLILGASSLVRPIAVPLGSVVLDIAFLGVLTVAASAMLRTERTMTRIEGGLLLSLYCAFIVTLML
jgi:cation:H+ antiporter